MAARSDRGLRTAGELVVSQARALTSAQALRRPLLARVVVLCDELLLALENPTAGRPLDWSELLSRRVARSRQVAALAAEVAPDAGQTLGAMASGRVAALSVTLGGQLPLGVRSVMGDVRLADLLRAALVELVVMARGAGLEQPAAVRDCARSLAAALAARHPGQTIEVRVPPATAVQLGALGQGPSHTRGTPPNVAETDELTWLDLATGLVSWAEARDRAAITASGSHVDDLAAMLPVVDLATLA